MTVSSSVDTGRWAALREDFSPPRLGSTVAIGLVLALVNALLGIALMSLIFSGPLAVALPTGIGVGLVGSAAVALVVAVWSGFPGMYAGIQDSSAAILALSAASIVATASSSVSVDTVVALMMVTSLATGAAFILLGTLRLGNVARFVPFPVVGGLLAGTGILILQGGLDILTTASPSPVSDTAHAAGLLVPGLVFAGAFVAASLRGWPSSAFLAILAAALVGFHATIRLAGVDVETSLDRGWLLGPFPEGGLWPGMAGTAVLDAEWTAIVAEGANIATVLLLVPLTLILYISALEVGTNSDLDVNDELRTTGWANLLSGAAGGPPGYLYAADTLISHRLLGPSRGGAVVAGVGMLGIVLVGGDVLELLPQFVIGGLLLFFGIEFLVEWLWTARRRMSRLDYALMAGIVVVIAVVGFLPGVAAGLAAAIVLFVYRYSRIDVVKHLLTAREHQSNIERSLPEAELLRRVGDQVLVLELHGFIFFGTANQIVDRIKQWLAGAPPLRFLIVDFRLVSGVDSSAVVLFERVALLAGEHRFWVVMTGMRPETRGQFAQLVEANADAVVTETDLDHGMAWCEEKLLDEYGRHAPAVRPLPDGLADRLDPYLLRRSFAPGECLMIQGDPTPGIYLIGSGRATVAVDDGSGGELRLRTLQPGTVLGEIGLYMREPCTATVVADTGCEVLHLSPESFDTLCRDDAGTAAELHAFVARTLAARVAHANRTIRALHG